MALVKPQFEVTDTKGSTEHYDSTVGTTPETLPASPDKIISEVWIENDITNTPATRELEVSFDGGVNYTIMLLGEGITWSPKGDKRVIHIKGSAASVKYKAIINFEEY